MPGYFIGEEDDENSPSGTYRAQQQRYRQVWSTGGGNRNRSAPQQYDSEGNPLLLPGRFQGGTSNRRAGLPQGGVVGTPNLGLASELMRWASQVPGGEDYLRSQGMMPQISQFGPPQQGSGYQNNVGQWAANQAAGMNWWENNPNNPNFRTGGAGGSRGNSYQDIINQGGYGAGGAAQQRNPTSALGGGANPFSFQQPNISMMERSRGGGNLEGGLQNAIMQMLGNPQYEQQLRTRSGDITAGAQRSAEQRTREDAIRRGASTQAGGDTDIRDQLNRIGFEGARSQQEGQLDIDRFLDQRRLGAISGGTNLLGQQFQNQRGLQELMIMLGALQAQGGLGGPQAGLQMILGGNR